MKLVEFWKHFIIAVALKKGPTLSKRFTLIAAAIIGNLVAFLPIHPEQR